MLPTWLCQKQQVRRKDDVSMYPSRGGGESPVRSFPQLSWRMFSFQGHTRLSKFLAIWESAPVRGLEPTPGSSGPADFHTESRICAAAATGGGVSVREHVRFCVAGALVLQAPEASRSFRAFMSLACVPVFCSLLI